MAFQIRKSSFLLQGPAEPRPIPKFMTGSSRKREKEKERIPLFCPKGKTKKGARLKELFSWLCYVPQTCLKGGSNQSRKTSNLRMREILFWYSRIWRRPRARQCCTRWRPSCSWDCAWSPSPTGEPAINKGPLCYLLGKVKYRIRLLQPGKSRRGGKRRIEFGVATPGKPSGEFSPPSRRGK